MKKYLNSNIKDIIKLLSITIDKSITWIYTNNDYKLNKGEIEKLNKLIYQSAQGTPVAYLEGKKGFYHLDFTVNKHTLIPRPETELIIDIVKKLKAKKILDLGTGSGIIAITLKSLRPELEVYATDISVKALEVARENAKIHNTIINFKLSNWFEKIKQKFDLIISNPPYIAADDKHLEKLRFEPITALTAKENGLADIKTIIKSAKNYLNKNGYLVLEHGYNQQQQIIKLFDKNWELEAFNDYNNQNRVILAKLC